MQQPAGTHDERNDISIERLVTLNQWIVSGTNDNGRPFEDEELISMYVDYFCTEQELLRRLRVPDAVFKETMLLHQLRSHRQHAPLSH